MPRLESRLSKSEQARNREAMLPLLERLQTLQAQVLQGGGAKSQQRMKERGKMLPRERVEALLDPKTPFLELSSLAANGMYQDESPGASLVAGIGTVCGRTCMIIASDASVKGGAIYPMTLKKHLRAQRIAQENRLLCFNLSNQPEPTCSIRPNCSLRRAGASSPTRPACRPGEFLRSPLFSAPPPPAEPTCRA